MAYSVEDWREAVAKGKTFLGYRSWQWAEVQLNYGIEKSWYELNDEDDIGQLERLEQ